MLKSRFEYSISSKAQSEHMDKEEDHHHKGLKFQKISEHQLQKKERKSKKVFIDLTTIQNLHF